MTLVVSFREALGCFLRLAARLTSTFKKIKRYFELKDHLDTTDEEIAALVPTRREENNLAALFHHLEDFESVSLRLQTDIDLILLDVRDSFGTLLDDQLIVLLCTSGPGD